jgi:pyruvate formate lyase activating enzyme
MGSTTGIKSLIDTSFVDWRGKVSAVAFLGGCNFRCPYCHNQELVLRPERLEDISHEWVLGRLRKHTGWVDGVCITGGEPTLSESLEPLISEIRSLGFLIKLDTNGSRPQVIEALIEANKLDSVSLDIKAPLRPRSYSRCAGVAVSLSAIRRSIEILQVADIEAEFRTTVVPSLLSAEDILEIAGTLPDGIPYRLQDFRPDETLDPEFKGVRAYLPEEMQEVRAQVARIRSSADEVEQRMFQNLEPHAPLQAVWAT